MRKICSAIQIYDINHAQSRSSPLWGGQDSTSLGWAHPGCPFASADESINALSSPPWSSHVLQGCVYAVHDWKKSDSARAKVIF